MTYFQGELIVSGRYSQWVLVGVAVVGIHCGRVDFDLQGEVIPEIERITLRAEKRIVSVGSQVEIGVTIEPPQAAVPGRSMTFAIDRFLLGSGSQEDQQVTVEVLSDATVPDLRLRVPLDGVEGQTANISATEDWKLGGDTKFVASVPRSQNVSIDGVSYAVVEGLELDAPLGLSDAERQPLVGQLAEIFFPRPDSAFAPGIYLGLQTTPEVFRWREGEGLRSFALSDGVNGPDEHITIGAFADPRGPYGDFLYICSASKGGGDGIFTLDSSGAFRRWIGFNNCNGLVFDENLLLDAPGFVPMYVNRNSTDTLRIDPHRNTKVIGTGLGVASCGHFLSMAGKGAFAGKLWLSGCGESDGAVLFGEDVEAIDEATVFIDDIPEIIQVSFGAETMYGDLMYVISASLGSVLAVRPDGAHFPILSGLDSPRAIRFTPDGKEIWIVDPGRGQVLRLRLPWIESTKQ